MPLTDLVTGIVGMMLLIHYMGNSLSPAPHTVLGADHCLTSTTRTTLEGANSDEDYGAWITHRSPCFLK